MSDSVVKYKPYRTKVGSTAECIKRLSFGSASPRASTTQLNVSEAQFDGGFLGQNLPPISLNTSAPLPETTTSSKVQVCLRVKPSDVRPKTIQVLDDSRIRATPPPGVAPTFKVTEYTFSRVFGPQAKQQEVFDHVAGGLVHSLLHQGKDGLIFAYGVTNSGKTFTVEGNKDNPGIVPQALQKIFATPPSLPVYVSYLQVYNDQVHDLQEPVPAPTDPFGIRKNLRIKLRDDSVLVEGLKETRISSLADGMAVLEKGRENRNTNDNSINSSSSRSHTVFVVRLGQAKLHIVDLAGSERGKRTKATGVRQVEASNINLSLSQLMQCLEAMRANQKLTRLYPDKPRDKPPFRPIPFRDCKLTMLFRDCLRGRNCAGVTMIVNASPEPLDFEETCQALRYGEMTRSTAIESSNPPVALPNAAAVPVTRYDYNGRMVRGFAIPSIEASTLPLGPPVYAQKSIIDNISKIERVSASTLGGFEMSLGGKRSGQVPGSAESRTSLRQSPPLVVVPTVLPVSLLRSVSKAPISLTTLSPSNVSSKSNHVGFTSTPHDIMDENAMLRKELQEIKANKIKQEVDLREELSIEMARALESMRARYEERLEKAQKDAAAQLLAPSSQSKTFFSNHPLVEDMKILADQLDECEAEMDRMRDVHKRDLEALQGELNNARRANVEATLQLQNAHHHVKQTPSTPQMVAEERKKVDRALRALEEEKEAHRQTVKERVDLLHELDTLRSERRIFIDREAGFMHEISELKDKLEVARHTINQQDRQISQWRSKVASPQQCSAQLSGVAPHLLLSKKKNKMGDVDVHYFRNKENAPFRANAAS